MRTLSKTELSAVSGSGSINISINIDPAKLAAIKAALAPKIAALKAKIAAYKAAHCMTAPVAGGTEG